MGALVITGGGTEVIGSAGSAIEVRIINLRSAGSGTEVIGIAGSVIGVRMIDPRSAGSGTEVIGIAGSVIGAMSTDLGTGTGGRGSVRRSALNEGGDPPATIRSTRNTKSRPDDLSVELCDSG